MLKGKIYAQSGQLLADVVNLKVRPLEVDSYEVVGLWLGQTWISPRKIKETLRLVANGAEYSAELVEYEGGKFNGSFLLRATLISEKITDS